MAITPLTLPSPRVGCLLADWSSPIEMEHAYTTGIVSSATTIAEERRSLRERPARILRGTVRGLSLRGGDRLRMALRHLQTGRQPWPIWQDARPVTASSASGVNAYIYLDTQYARFLVDARVWVWDEVAGEATNAELCTIVSLYSDKIQVGNLAASRTLGRTMVAPSMDLDLHLQMETSLLTGRYATSNLILDEFSGKSAYPALSSFPPSGFSTYLGDPVLEILPDWSLTVGRAFRREGYSEHIGVATRRYAVGPVREIVRFSITPSSRAAAWAVMRFIDSLKGRLHPFWIVAPEERYSYVGHGVTGGYDYIDVEALDSLTNDAPLIQNVGIVGAGGTIAGIHPVLTVTDTGTAWRLKLSGTLSLPSYIERISDAYHVRLDRDTWTEKWITTEIGRFDIDCQELVEEKTTGVTGMPSTL